MQRGRGGVPGASQKAWCLLWMPDPATMWYTLADNVAALEPIT